MHYSQAVPRLFRWVSLFLYSGVLVFNLYIWWDTWPLVPRREAELVGAFVLLILQELFEASREGDGAPWYQVLLSLAGRMLLIEIIVETSPTTFSAALYVTVPFNAYFSLGEKIGIGLGLFYLALYTVRSWFICLGWSGCFEESMAGLLTLSISMAFCISMAKVISNEQASRSHAEALLKELEISHKKLRAYATQVAELAAAEERNRLARDVHDSLGHYLTAISVQLEKALAFRERNPQEADQAIRDAKRTAKEALQDVRQSMGALRSTPEVFVLSAALTDLVQNARGGLGVELQMDGTETGFSKAVLMTLFRAAQEGLTNIQKHAHGDQAILQVHFSENAASLSLSDNGCGFDLATFDGPTAERRGCFGLRGLQERVELIGGRMRITSAPNQGTTLLITVPKNPRVLDMAVGMSSWELLA